MKCSCGKTAIWKDYSGRQLCKLCFVRLIDRRIGRTIRANKLISKDDKIAVAISGGKDSTLALHYLTNYCRHRKIAIFAIYVFRGDIYSTKCMLACEKLCKSLKVPLHIFSFSKELDITFKNVVDITKKVGANRCSVCGVFRRRLLNDRSKDLGATKLATGHNLSDDSESYLMNFVRGEIITFGHLAYKSEPKREGFVQRIRPLRDLPNEQIKLYCDIKKYKYLPQPCPCRIGSLRYNIRELLKGLKKARPTAEFAIVKTGDWIRNKVIEETKKKKINKCKKCGSLCSKDICKVCDYLALK